VSWAPAPTGVGNPPSQLGARGRGGQGQGNTGARGPQHGDTRAQQEGLLLLLLLSPRCCCCCCCCRRCYHPGAVAVAAAAVCCHVAAALCPQVHCLQAAAFEVQEGRSPAEKSWHHRYVAAGVAAV
jgi:hypothetical protein